MEQCLFLAYAGVQPFRQNLHKDKKQKGKHPSDDWKDTCQFCITYAFCGMKARVSSERGVMTNVAGDASIQIKAL